MNELKQLQADVNAMAERIENLIKRGFKKSGKITDRVKSYEDACEELGLDAHAELPYKTPTTKRQRVVNTRLMLDIIAEALQEGFPADYGDSKSEKWRPWFEWDKRASGFVFSYSYYDSTRANSGLGSRGAFATCEISDYFGKQFIALHNEAMTK